MQFEFDPEKSRANQAKHGIDFVEAQRLWDDSDLVEIKDYGRGPVYCYWPDFRPMLVGGHNVQR